MPVNEIKFVGPNNNSRKRSADSDCAPTLKKVPQPTETELETFYGSISEAKNKPAILRITPPFAESFIPRLSLSTFPQPLTEYYKPAALDLSYPDWLKECEETFESIKVYKRMFGVIRNG